MIAKHAVQRILTIAAAAGLMACAASAGSFLDSVFGSKEEPPPPPPWEKTADGVIVKPAAGPAKAVRLVVMRDGIVRVTVSPDGSFDHPKSLMVRAAPDGAKFDVAADGSTLTLKTAKLTAKVVLNDGAVSFLDANGKPVLTGANAGSFVPVKIDGQDFYTVRAEFNRGTDEGLYGFGQHQNGQMNLNGEDVILAQHNTDVAVPMIVSTKNYGVLWDNYSITHLGYPKDYDTLSATLSLYDADGKKGGLTARYYDGDKLLTTRVENDPNYEFIEDTNKNFPPEVANPKGKTVPHGEPTPTSPNLKVVYEGCLETDKTGVHKFRFYVGGYFKLWIDDKLVMDSWRQGWNAWYRNLDIPMVAGQKVKFRAEWRNEGASYLRFLHIDPMPEAERHELSIASDVAKTIDYYYIAADSMDGVISGYRTLTGKAPIMPKWSYGFWQSRQRYDNQNELVAVLKEYRKLKLPIDVIVQDWRYWKDPEWGSHEFDPTRFPDPQKMVDQVHQLNGKLMIVIWPKFYKGLKNFKEFDEKGLMYRYSVDQGYIDWVGPGYVSSNYDAYSQEARDIYWRQVKEHIDGLGPDAWWMDNDEPDIHSNLSIEAQIKMRGPTAYGPGALVYNSYPLEHVCGFYDHWQAAHPDQRTFILTRSLFGGGQRCSAAVWSGDVVSRWSDMREQVAAGVNFSLSGIPNWTFDIGGYTMETRFGKWDMDVRPSKYIKPKTPADLAEFNELYTRWFQFGAFAPVFRSHGELRRREIWEISKPGTEIYNTISMYQRLRYRLLPYIYTLAANTYYQDGTIMRGLVMDFGADKKVWNIADEYMLGHDFLVAPVTEYKARSREVYLPAGAGWYDLYTGKHYEGGQTVTADAPLKYMPVFVRGGAVVPTTGEKIQYTDQKPDAPITVFVYTGKDGSFSLYEDDGTSNAYQNGAFSRIPLTYDDASGTLTIGARQGEYPNMVASRTFKVRFISGASKDAFNFDAKATTVQYDGSQVSVTRK